MSKNPIEYRSKIYNRNDTSLVDKDYQFIVSGAGNMFKRIPIDKTDIIPPTALHKLDPSIDTTDLVDIWCCITVTYYITKHNIYSSYVSSVSDTESNRSLLMNLGRYITNIKTDSFEKIVLPNNIVISPTSYVKKIASGISHSIILMNNNRMLIFGDNTYGQLGEKKIIRQIIEPKLINTNQFDGKIIDIVCGNYHTLILTDKGTVFATGRDNLSQIALGSYSLGPLPDHLDLSGNDDENINKLMQYLARDDVFEFTKLDIDDKIVKIAANNNSFFLAESGVLYGTGIYCLGYNKIQPVELFYDTKMSVSDIWCTPTSVFTILRNGDIYMAGDNTNGNMFTQLNQNNGNIVYLSFVKNDYLSQKGICRIIGSPYASIAIDSNNKDIYISGTDRRKFFSDEDTVTVSGRKNLYLSSIAQKNSDYDMNIQNGALSFSVTFKAKDGYTRDICYMVCNLYESIFSDKNSFSDIIFA